MTLGLLRDEREESYTNELFNNLGIDNLLSKYEILNENQSNNLDFLNHRLADSDKLLLLNLSSNPVDVTTYKHYLENPRVKILSGNLEHLFSDSEYVFFPYFFATQLQERNFKTPGRQFRFSYLSSQPRPHRLYLYQKVKQFITEHDCFAVHAEMSDKFNYVSKYGTVDLSSNLPYYSNPIEDQDYTIYSNDHTNMHNAYSAYFNITGESSDIDNFVFLSEKTWKCFRSYCFPITYGNQGTKTALSRLGFELGYDLDLSCVDKAEWISDIMGIWDMGYCKNFYDQNFEIVRHNFDNFYSKNIRQVFADHLKLHLEL